MSFLFCPTPMMGKNIIPWTPLHISSSITFWLDASDASTISLTGSSVLQWNSKIGSLNATPALTTTRPTYSATGRNSKPALLFNGTNQRMVMSATSGSGGIAAGTTPNTISAVAYSNVGGWRHLLHYGAGSNNNYRALGISNLNTAAFAGFSNDINTSSAWQNTDNFPIVAIKPTTISSIYVPDSATISTGASGLNTGSGAVVALGSDNTGTAWWSGAIQEVIMFNRALTLNEAQKLQGYYAWKWGLTSKLHSTHPYKSVPPTSQS